VSATSKKLTLIAFLPPVLLLLCYAIGVAIGMETGVGLAMFKGEGPVALTLNLGYLLGALALIIGSPICLILAVVFSIIGMVTKRKDH
jgi:hypothetical protein